MGSLLRLDFFYREKKKRSVEQYFHDYCGVKNFHFLFNVIHLFMANNLTALLFAANVHVNPVIHQHKHLRDLGD